MPIFEWPMIEGANALPGVFAMTAAMLGVAVTVGAVMWLVAWRRGRTAVARMVRASVEKELARDPALNGLSLRLATRTPWAGQTTVWLAGVVPSPWYRYAVIRAAARAVSRTQRTVRIVDEIAIAERRASPVPARRSA